MLFFPWCFIINYSFNRYVVCTVLHIISHENLSVTLKRFTPLKKVTSHGRSNLAIKEEGQCLIRQREKQALELSGPHRLAKWCTPSPYFTKVVRGSRLYASQEGSAALLTAGQVHLEPPMPATLALPPSSENSGPDLAIVKISPSLPEERWSPGVPSSDFPNQKRLSTPEATRA